jgi:hypothetical protein
MDFQRHLRIDRNFCSVHKRRSQGVACRCHRVIFFKPLGLFKFPIICLILKKINIFFNIITKKV